MLNDLHEKEHVSCHNNSQPCIQQLSLIHVKAQRLLSVWGNVCLCLRTETVNISRCVWFVFKYAGNISAAILNTFCHLSLS